MYEEGGIVDGRLVISLLRIVSAFVRMGEALYRFCVNLQLTETKELELRQLYHKAKGPQSYFIYI